MTKQYTAKNGHLQYKPSQGWLIHVIESGEPIGYCLACAEEVYGVEPDAEREHCPSCYEPKVYGAEELYVRGLYYDEDREADIQQARSAGYIK